MGDKKTKGFKVSDELLAKVNNVQAELGVTSEEFMQTLLTTYESAMAAKRHPEWAGELDEFARKTRQLNDMYLLSMERSMEAAANAREESKRKIESLQQALADCQLQLQIERSRAKELAERVTEVDKLHDDIVLLNAEHLTMIDGLRAQIQQQAEQLQDKQACLDFLAAQLDDAKKSKSKYAELSKEYDELAQRYEETESERRKLLFDGITKDQTLLVEVGKVKEQWHKYQLDVEKAQREMEREYLNTIRKLEVKCAELQRSTIKAQS